MRYRCIYSSLPAFRPSAKLVPPTTPSADFCAAVRPPYDGLSLVTETQRRPPEVRSTAFTACPSDLPPRSLIVMDFAIGCSLVRPGRPRYPLLVHRAAALLHASFRPHLAVTPLRFANPSPLSGWIEDFHLQAADHARHTACHRARIRATRWLCPPYKFTSRRHHARAGFDCIRRLARLAQHRHFGEADRGELVAHQRARVLRHRRFRHHDRPRL
jgi:hypothetical protein